MVEHRPDLHSLECLGPDLCSGLSLVVSRHAPLPFRPIVSPAGIKS
jgi:hypothetical protein